MITKQWWLHPLRQTFGLLAFVYITVHATVYATDEMYAVSCNGVCNAATSFKPEISLRRSLDHRRRHCAR